MSQRGQAEINKDFTSSNPLWKSTPGKRNKGRRFQHNNSSQTPNKKRHYAQHQTRNPTRFKQTTTTTTPGNSIQQLGFFGSVPSLQDLHRENRKRARRHYKHHHTSKYSNQPYLEYHNAGSQHQTPQVPPAPTPNRFVLGAEVNPLATPNTIKGTGASAVKDKLVEGEGLPADLDFYGTNAGLVMQGTGVFTSEDNEDDHSDGNDDHGDSISYSDDDLLYDNRDKERNNRFHASFHSNRGGHKDTGHDSDDKDDQQMMSHRSVSIIQRLRRRISEDSSYIAELEDENLKLRERVEMMQQQFMIKDTAAGDGAGDAQEEHIVVEKGEVIKNNDGEMKTQSGDRQMENVRLLHNPKD